MRVPDKLIREALEEVVQRFLIPHFKSKEMNATGNWINSLEVEVSENKGVIKGAKYTEQLVFGRKPGKIPPAKALEQWAMIKLGVSQDKARSVAFAIAKKIAKEGTELHKQGGSDLLEVLEKPEVTHFLNQKIGTWCKLYIKEELQRTAKQILS